MRPLSSLAAALGAAGLVGCATGSGASGTGDVGTDERASARTYDVAGYYYRPRVLNPGRSPDAASASRYGTDGELNTVTGNRNPMGGESWTNPTPPTATEPRTPRGP